ncbi:hypothetical protein CHELA41_22062 [Hyphomicrobiales bacterium]|jgi:tRNA-binding protein|nr:hypothetical protein CHELA41_22062 [Hyphomicrobiales bacterium]
MRTGHAALGRNAPSADNPMNSKSLEPALGRWPLPYLAVSASRRRKKLSAPVKPEAVYDDFAKLDIRIGRIVHVEPFPRARNPSYKVAVDLGELGIRWSSAQITSYTPDQLTGTDVACVVNFAPRNIAGFQSEILILGARNALGHVILLTPRSDVARGETVF